MFKRLLLVILTATALVAWPALATAASHGSEAEIDPVREGDTGELVAFWQDRLNDWIVLSDDVEGTIAVDGVFGPETAAATLEFQEANNEIAADAVVNPEDRVALREAIDALESDDAASANAVAPGDTGELVAFWQDRLNDYFVLRGSDEDTIAVDGIFGPATAGATREFQIASDAVEADGVVHPEDRVALREAIDALESEDGATDTVVTRGDTGALVAFWQDRLNDWFALSDAANPITVDGIFGPATERATLVFQEASDRVPTDAVVDPEDRVALREAIDSLETSEEVPATDAAVTDDYPASGQPALLQRITTRQVDGNDQIVFEYAAGDDFSYKVDYVAEALAVSGQPVEVAGDYDLLVATAPAARVDLSGDEPVVTYDGQERFEPRDLDTVAEIALVEDFEGAMTWVLGTTVDSPFRVEAQEDPLRLVITLTQE